MSTSNDLTGNTPFRVSNEPVIDASTGNEIWPADYNPHGRLDLGGPDTRRIHIQSREGADDQNFVISLTLDPKMLYTYNGTTWDLVANLNNPGGGGIMDTPAEITIAFRELEYCDSDGNTKRILVLASEPYDPA